MTNAQFSLVALAVFATPLVIVWVIGGAPPFNLIYHAVIAHRAARRRNHPVVMLDSYREKKRRHHAR